jgi:hypothetical protein
MQIFVKTLTGKTTSPWPNGCISDKSLPRLRSLCLARQVSASHDKSPPRTTSLAPTSAWAHTHSSSEATNAYGEANLHIMQGRQLAAMQATCPGMSLKCEPDWPCSHHITINLCSTTRKTQPEALKHPL